MVIHTTLLLALLLASDNPVAPINILEDAGTFSFHMSDAHFSDMSFEWSKDGSFAGYRALAPLPVIDLYQKLQGKRSAVWEEWVRHSTFDDYWKKAAFLDRLDGLGLPVFHQSGWYDGDANGTRLNFRSLAKRGRAIQKMVIGPWGHTDRDSRADPFGEDHGPDAVIGLSTLYLRWFDRWLKGIDNGIEKEPLVSLFVMGSGKWLHGSTYPLPGTAFTKYYLARSNDAGARPRSGMLTTGMPGDAAGGSMTYVYDPGDPTPARTEGREDVLVFDLPPLDEPLTIVGPITAVLHARTTARDTDWCGRLHKLDENNREKYLVHGILRARFRDSLSQPRLLEPGEICRHEIDLWHTGIRLSPGERLRLVVASAMFPAYARNLNTGGNKETETKYLRATYTIHLGGAHPSHLLLPVIADPKLESFRR